MIIMHHSEAQMHRFIQTQRFLLFPIHHSGLNPQPPDYFFKPHITVLGYLGDFAHDASSVEMLIPPSST